MRDMGGLYRLSADPPPHSAPLKASNVVMAPFAGARTAYATSVSVTTLD